MNNEIIPERPPMLVRQLSEHHWQAAIDEQGNDVRTWAGTTYDNDGNVLWEFYIVNRGDHLERHSICVRHNIHDIVTIIPREEGN